MILEAFLYRFDTCKFPFSYFLFHNDDHSNLKFTIVVNFSRIVMDEKETGLSTLSQ